MLTGTSEMGTREDANKCTGLTIYARKASVKIVCVDRRNIFRFRSMK